MILPRPPLPLLFATLAASTAAACTCQPAQPGSVAGRDAPPPEAAPAAELPTPAAEPRRHDVVLITLDTTRADHLGLYGYPRPTSPHLDAFAETAVVFDRFIVPMATTLPTHTSMLTGVSPHEHGVLANVQHGGARFVPSPGLVPLARHLADRGYQTAAFVSAVPLQVGTGIEEGFQTFTDPNDAVPPGAATARPRKRKRAERPAAETADEAIAWLQQASERPLLLWVHFYDPHNPYRAPAEDAALFPADDPARDAWLAPRAVTPTTRRPTGQPVEAIPTIDAYDAEIHYMDRHVQRVLDAVAARGRTDHTVILIAGDHGEGLNQHGEPGHGLLWAEQLHAPLLVRAPGLAPRRVPTTTTASDLLPLLAAVADLPGEDALTARSSGHDPLSPPPDPAALSQTSLRQAQFGVTARYKLTTDTVSCMAGPDGQDAVLYDVLTDPYELDPKTDDPRLAGCVTSLVAAYKAAVARGEALGAGGTRQASEEDVGLLEELGYVE